MRNDRLPSGYWIVPGLIVGGLFWLGLIHLFLSAFE